MSFKNFDKYSRKVKDSIKSIPFEALLPVVSAVVIVYLCFLLGIMATDQESLHSRFSWYLAALVLPIVGAFIWVYIQGPSAYILIAGVASLILFLLIFFGTEPFTKTARHAFRDFYSYQKITKLSNDASLLVFIILKILGIGLVVIGLGLFHQLFLTNFSIKSDFVRFLVQFVFFIPCLFNDLVAWILSEWNSTPNVAFVLFMLEMIFLLLYLYVPSVLDRVPNRNGHQLLKEPIVLSKETTLGKGYESKTSTDFRFAFSLWISVNSSNSTKYSGDAPIMLFRYGDLSHGAHISYTNNDFWNFAVDASSELLYMPAQRWNNIVFNYNASQVDLFINGELSRSMTADMSFSQQEFISGMAESPIHGSICNVVLFPEALTKSQITQNYNLLQSRNPPVNNLAH